MIVVWNCNYGHTYGFLTLEDYKEFAKANEGINEYTCWNDYVYDVGSGGCTEDKERLDLTDFNISCTE